MSKSIIKKAAALMLMSMLIVVHFPKEADASWYLQKLTQQGQTTVANPTNPSTTVQSPQQKNSGTANQSSQSTADLIRSLRNQAASNNTVQTVDNSQNQTSSSPTQPTKSPAAPVSTNTGLNSQETTMLQLVNEERSKNGLKPLQLHVELAGLAKLKSQDIVHNNYFSHTSPTYGSFYQMVRDAGIPYRQVGENLAKTSNVQKAHMLLMASEGHRNNILSPHFTHIGIGIAPDQYGIVATQLFIAR
ncbi:MAG: CAP domain-containing protein [Bacillota bacterium]